MSDETADGGAADDGMSERQIGLGAVGLLTLAAAFTVADGPVTGAVTAAQAALGSDYLLAASLGGIALAFAASAFVSGGRTVRQATMPETERPTPVPTPGDGFDDQLSGWRSWLPLVGPAPRDVAYRRLRRAAIEAVVTGRGCSRADAERRVDEGTWTADAVAADFLARGAGRPSLSVRLAALWHGETSTQYCARRTVDVVSRYRGDGERR